MLPEFDYVRPATWAEALGALVAGGHRARPLAGGTDLFVQMRRGLVKAEVLVDLRPLGLDYCQEEGSGLRIGALTPIAELASATAVRSRAAVLAEAARVLGSPQIRNRATVGGNLCNAAPSADLAPPLLVLGARCYLRSLGGQRVVPLSEFFRGPGSTVLGEGEVLAEVEVPAPPPGMGFAYLKHRRSAEDIAVVGVAAGVWLDGNRIREARIALGAVAPVPLRVPSAEEYLRGQEWGEKALWRAAQLAEEASSPIDDVRATAAYRRHLVRVLTHRALALAGRRAEGGEKVCRATESR